MWLERSCDLAKYVSPGLVPVARQQGNLERWPLDDFHLGNEHLPQQACKETACFFPAPRGLLAVARRLQLRRQHAKRLTALRLTLDKALQPGRACLIVVGAHST